MKNTATQVNRIAPLSKRENHSTEPILGRLVAINNQGEAQVTALHGLQQPVHARLSSILNREELLDAAARQQTVLLIYEDNTPVIIGLVWDRLPERPVLPDRIEHERLILEAKEEVVLRCGPGSITLRRDGKVIIKGVEVVSRAKQTNRIRGAAVKIN